ncbi:phosphohydrolase [Streptacidiphilus sp. N1-3]|uniref:Phosphohydrolase n=1 Tax=Streptacidiphilus alkalitolerans TaxID=3342712 RepID=A0ABV6X841_9ACTN
MPSPAPALTLADVDALAARAHAGQFDKIGVPYVNHVRAVSAGLAPFGVGLQMAGLLHDTLEDTTLTPELLLAAGVPFSVVTLVRKVTNREGVAYEDMLDGIRADYSATLLKVSDNAHNSLPDRAAQLPPEQRLRLAEKYRHARSVLWPSVPHEDVRAILRIVNPSLLTELTAASP